MDDTSQIPPWNQVHGELQRILAEEPPITTPREGIMLLAEQLFAIWETIRNESDNPTVFQPRLRYEAMQLAALALRFLIELPTMKGNVIGS